MSVPHGSHASGVACARSGPRGRVGPRRGARVKQCTAWLLCVGEQALMARHVATRSCPPAPRGPWRPQPGGDPWCHVPACKACPPDAEHRHHPHHIPLLCRSPALNAPALATAAARAAPCCALAQPTLPRSNLAALGLLIRYQKHLSLRVLVLQPLVITGIMLASTAALVRERARERAHRRGAGARRDREIEGVVIIESGRAGDEAER